MFGRQINGQMPILLMSALFLDTIGVKEVNAEMDPNDKMEIAIKTDAI
jgi:hypothetical protein